MIAKSVLQTIMLNEQYRLKMKKVRLKLSNTGERIVPPSDEEISFVFARHRFAYQYSSQFVKDCTVVDIGCGTGYGCKILSEHARFVLGIDYDCDSLDYCKNNFCSRNIYYAQMNADFLGLKRFFDVAVSFQVIEHVLDAHDFIKQLKEIVKPNGKIFISTPNFQKSGQPNRRNPFHQHEFDYNQFHDLINEEFSSFDILGVVYESQNLARRIIQRLPCYRWGIFLKRRSKIKKLANRMFHLTKFRVTDDDLEKSMDLLAVCENL